MMMIVIYSSSYDPEIPPLPTPPRPPAPPPPPSRDELLFTMEEWKNISALSPALPQEDTITTVTED